MRTASALERIMACPASEALDHVQEESIHAARGTAIHGFLEQLNHAVRRGLSLEAAREEALGTVTLEYRPVCEAIDVHRLPPLDRFAPEYAMAWHPGTGEARALGHLGARRAYLEAGIDETWIAGTADLAAVGVRAGAGGARVAVIGDWKSGWSKRTEARRNPQLLFLAMVAMQVFDCTSAEVFLVIVEEGVPPRVDHASIGPFDLAVFAAELEEALRAVERAKHARAAGGQLVMFAGAHCTYCPAFKACPAKRSLIAGIPGKSEIDLRRATELDAAAIAERFEWYQAARQAMARLESAFREWALTNPITLSDGRVYGPVLMTKEEIDGAVAFPLVRQFVAGEFVAARERGEELDGPATARAHVEAEGAFAMETTKTALARVARTVAGIVGRPIARVEDELLEHLRKNGAVLSRPKTEAHVRKPAPAARTAAK